MENNTEYFVESVIDKYYILHTVWALINIVLLIVLLYFLIKLYRKFIKYLENKKPLK